MFNKKKSFANNPSNQDRMILLTNELLKIGYETLATILLELIESSPNYASQILEPEFFLSSIVEILHGLTFINLEEFIDSHEGAVTAHQISTQANSIKKSLYAHGDFILIANTPAVA